MCLTHNPRLRSWWLRSWWLRSWWLRSCFKTEQTACHRSRYIGGSLAAAEAVLLLLSSFPQIGMSTSLVAALALTHWPQGGRQEGWGNTSLVCPSTDSLPVVIIHVRNPPVALVSREVGGCWVGLRRESPGLLP